MADIPIHLLPSAGSLNGSEIIPVDDGSATRQATIAMIRSGLSPAGHGHAIGDVTGLQGALDAKAPLASPTFTGTVKLSATSRFSGYQATAYVGTNSPNTELALRGARGSEAAPQTVQNADVIGTHVFYAYDGTSWQVGGFLRVTVDGAPSAGSVPGAISLHVGGGAEVLRCRADRSVTWGGNAVVVLDASGLLSLRSFTVATMPTASPAGRLAYVADGASNRRLAVSDGANWRWPDGTLVS